MKKPFASLIRSVSDYLRRPPRTSAERTRQPRHTPLSREQFRELLAEALEDPATRRLVARRLLLPVFPIAGGQPTCNTPAGDVAHGDFGSIRTDSGDYTFSRSKVGIGTASPEVRLHVVGTTNPTSAMEVRNEATSGGQDANLTIRTEQGSAGDPFLKFLIVGAQAVVMGIDNDDGNQFKISKNGLGSTDWLVIDNSGKVGIGKTNPAAKLDVAGNINTSGSVVIGGTATKQSSGGPEKLSFQDSDQDKVCIANFKKTNGTTYEAYARFLLDMKGNMEWAGPSTGPRPDVDQNVLLGWAAVGRLNCQGVPEADSGFWVVSWKNSTLEEDVDGTETLIDVADASQFTTDTGKNFVRCDDELMEVTGRDLVNNRLTVTRGVEPSDAAEHDNGALITSLGQPEDHPRIGLNFVGSTIKFSNGANPSDVSISRPGANQLAIEGRVGIGTTNPAASAVLDLTSTSGALLVPRMTTTERNALTAVNGMIIYNTTTNQMQGYINSAWTAL